MNARKLLLAAVACALAILPGSALSEPAADAASGNQPPPAAAAAKARDYGAGFQALYPLGFPDVANAEYVKLSAYGGGGSHNMESYFFEYELRLSGNAWMLEEKPKEKGRFVIGTCRVRDVYDSRSFMKARMQARRAAAESNSTDAASGSELKLDALMQGSWKKADAAKDAQRLLEHLRTAAKGGDARSGRFSSVRDSGVSGQAFLMAAHFYRKGLTNEANEIVALLFESAGDSREVVAQAANTLADERLDSVNQTLFDSGNWTAYATNLDALAVTFGKMWTKAPAVRLLAEKVRQRAALFEPPAIEGEGLTDEDRALARELANPEEVRSAGNIEYLGPWVLPRQDAARGMRGAGGKRSAIQRIAQRGMKSVPMLIALAGDGYLVAAPPTSSRVYERYSYSRDSTAGEDQAEKIYRTMPRPVTRGELATALLRSVTPIKDERGFSSGDSGDDVREAAAAWYKENRDKTPGELARIYLKEGGRSQVRAAAAYMAKRGTPEDMKSIESFFIESGSPEEALSMVSEYVEARGPEAKEFLAKFEARLSAPAAGGDAQMFRAGRNQDYIKRQLASLHSMTESHSFSNLLAGVTAGSQTVSEASSQMYRALRRSSPESALADILAAAGVAPEPRTAVELLAMCAGIRQLAARGEGAEDPFGVSEEGEEPEGETAPDARLDIARNAPAWRKLLADTRPVGADGGRGGTVGDAAARAIDSLYGDADEGSAAIRMWEASSGGGMPDARYVMGPKAREIYRARAEALLAGKSGQDLPQFPKLQPLTDEQKRALTERLLKAADAGLAVTVQALSVDESLALTAMARTNQALNAKLAPVAARIVDASIAPAGSAWAGAIAALKGRALDRGVVEQLLETARKALDQGQVVAFDVSRLPRLGGITIEGQEIAPGSREYKEMVTARMLGDGGSPEVSGYLSGPGCAASAVWTRGGAAAAPATAAAPASEDAAALDTAVAEVEAELRRAMVREQEEFWKQVDALCAGKGNVCRSATIQLMSRPAPRDAAPDGGSQRSDGAKPR